MPTIARHAALRPLGAALLRTPAAPTGLLAFIHQSPAVATAQSHTAATHRQALASELARLADVCARDEIADALHIGSAALAEELASGGIEDARGECSRAAAAAYRYVSRMATRATPYGAFAAISLVPFQPLTTLAWSEPFRCEQRARADHSLLQAMGDALARTVVETPRAHPHVTLFANPTLWRSHADWRYYEATRDSLGRRRYALTEVSASSHLDRLIAACWDGASIGSLFAALTTLLPSASEEDLASYLQSLLEAQVLCPPQAPGVLGTDALDAVSTLVADLERGGLSTTLRAARMELRDWPQQPRGARDATRRALKAIADQAGVHRYAGPELHVDLTSTSAGIAIGPEYFEACRAGIEVLHSLFGDTNDQELEAYKEEFERKFDRARVPLLQALDPVRGVPFGISAIRGPFDFALLADAPPLRSPARDRSEAHMPSDVLTQLIGTGVGTDGVLRIPGIQSRSSLPPRAPLPQGICALATLLDPSADHDRCVLALDSVSGMSATVFASRFAYANTDLHRHIVELAAAEQAEVPDVLLAEINYVPSGRHSNVVQRPLIRSHYIDLAPSSTLPVGGRLRPQELELFLSGNRLVLWSSKDNKEVWPRLSCAHRPDPRLHSPLYCFLVALQCQGFAAGLRWEWRELGSLAALPRVVHGRTVLARARWRLTAQDTKALCSANSHGAFSALQGIRDERRLPRFIALKEADNLLAVDLDSPLSVEAFRKALTPDGPASIVEQLPGERDGVITGPNGQRRAELAIPFIVRQRLDPAWRARRPAARTTQQNGADLSHTWVYAKLYMSPADADSVLLDCIRPLSRDLRMRGLVHRWFFLRYADPGDHLRLRCEATTPQAIESIAAMVREASRKLQAAGLVHKAQFDTYQREVERYGGDQALDIVETLFWLDSDTALTMIAADTDANPPHDRWRLLLRSVDALVNTFLPESEERAAFIAAQRANMESFWTDVPRVRHWVGAFWRAQRGVADALVEGSGGGVDSISEAIEARRRSMSDAIHALRQLERSGQLEQSWNGIVDSMVHMHVNRLMPTEARRQEYLAYELLWRVDRARAARPALATPSGVLVRP